MSVFNCQGIFDYLDSNQKVFLNSKFKKTGVKIMPHEISGPLNISNCQAINILTALQAASLSENYIVVYHNCEPDYAVEYIPFEKGFPSLPWFCDNCQEQIENIDELSFSLMAISKAPIIFT
ncbi:hypothetical protein U2F10_35975 [Leptothoe sp. EHU-05/26/07-4]